MILLSYYTYLYHHREYLIAELTSACEGKVKRVKEYQQIETASALKDQLLAQMTNL
jgi:hypothetical protein